MKKNILKIALTTLLFTIIFVSVNAQTQIISGLKTPRLTTAQRDQINVTNNPAANGLVVFNTDISKLQFYNGVKWVDLPEDLNFNHIVDSIANHVTQKLTDSIMSNVTVTGEKGIVVTGSGSSDIHIALPDGSKDGQILEWDNTAGKWIVSNNKNIKQLEVVVSNGIIKTESLIFAGATTTSTKAIKVVGVQPIITGDALMKKTLLSVNATAEIGANNIEWLINIKNNNINATATCTLSKVVISYICEDDLTSDTQASYVNVGW